MLVKNILLLLLGFCMSVRLHAQDPQFTQYYAMPIALNPAMTGNEGGSRVIFNYRNQWVGMPANFQTYGFSADHAFAGSPIAVGLYVSQDKAGRLATPITQLNLQAAASYTLFLGGLQQLSFGLQVGMMRNSLRFSDALFGDQIVDLFAPPVPNSNDPLLATQTANRSFADVSTGVLYMNSRLWAGLGVQHLNRPDAAFREGARAPLPVRWNAYAGYTIPLRADRSQRRPDLEDFVLVPNLLFRHQGTSDQLSAGLYGIFQPLMVGLWYRGIPLWRKARSSAFNQDAFSVLVGLRYQGWRLAYNYDLTLSKMPFDKASSHEVTLSYHFFLGGEQAYKAKASRMLKRQRVTCPIPWI